MHGCTSENEAVWSLEMGYYCNCCLVLHEAYTVYESCCSILATYCRLSLFPCDSLTTDWLSHSLQTVHSPLDVGTGVGRVLGSRLASPPRFFWHIWIDFPVWIEIIQQRKEQSVPVSVACRATAANLRYSWRNWMKGWKGREVDWWSFNRDVWWSEGQGFSYGLKEVRMCRRVEKRIWSDK